MRISRQTLNRIITSEIRSLMESKRSQATRRPAGRRSLYDTLLEDADPKKIQTPLRLSDVEKQKELMQKRVSSGSDKLDGGSGDDIVQKADATIAAKELKPSQSTMDVKKGVQFAFSAMLKVKPMFDGPGGAVGAIISKDNHIMDGHHRWIATLMVDPKATMSGPKLGLPALALIKALNMLTVGKFGQQGQPGTGGFDQFQAKTMEPIVLECIQKGYWAQSDAAACKQAALEFVGAQSDVSDEDLAKQVAQKFESNIRTSKNWNVLPKGAPDRVDMPVIHADKGQVDVAVNALTAGEVDLNPPFGDEKPEGDKDKAPQNSGRLRNGAVMVERWQRLAGLIR